MEGHLDAAMAMIIDDMLRGFGHARSTWQGEGPGRNLEFRSYGRPGHVRKTVSRRNLIGEGLMDAETLYLMFDRMDGGDCRLTGTSEQALTKMIEDAVRQKERLDAILSAGMDPNLPPLWSITMHRIGQLFLSLHQGERSIVEIDGGPALVVRDGPPPFPIVKGSAKDSGIHQQTVSTPAGDMIFKDKLGPGLFLEGCILPDTVVQSMVGEDLDVAAVVAHPLFQGRTGVTVKNVTIQKNGTHLHLSDVQDAMATR